MGGEFTYQPKWDPKTVLNHRHFNLKPPEPDRHSGPWKTVSVFHLLERTPCQAPIGDPKGLNGERAPFRRRNINLAISNQWSSHVNDALMNSHVMVGIQCLLW